MYVGHVRTQTDGVLFLVSGFAFLQTNNIQLSPKIQEHTSFPVRNEESDIGAVAQTEQNAATTHFE